VVRTLWDETAFWTKRLALAVPWSTVSAVAELLFLTVEANQYWIDAVGWVAGMASSL